MTRRRWIVLLALAAFAATGRAASEPPPDVCETQANTVEMIACGDWLYGQADMWLNQVYQEALARLDAEGKALLRDAQRAWLPYRDATCLLSRDAARGGTAAPVLQLGCLEAVTLARAREIGADIQGMEAPPYWPMIMFEHVGALGAFQCGGRLLEARIGLASAEESGSSDPIVRLVVGNEMLDFPVGGDAQDAFCGLDLTLSTVKTARAGCDAVRIDDGMCDGFVVHWDEAAKELRWSRN